MVVDREREVQSPPDRERGDYIAKYLLLHVRSIPPSPGCERECSISKGWVNHDAWELLQIG